MCAIVVNPEFTNEGISVGINFMIRPGKSKATVLNGCKTIQLTKMAKRKLRIPEKYNRRDSAFK